MTLAERIAISTVDPNTVHPVDRADVRDHNRAVIANPHLANGVPEWIRRAQEHRLPVRDYTRY
jgi:hypothetical protein